MGPVGDAWQKAFSLDAPGKIVCVGLNYFDHATESALAVPSEPLLFGKFANTVIGPGEAIVIPPASSHVDAEAELALVIGERVRNVSREQALDCVYGYTAGNDVSARDLQFSDGQWFRGKGFDTFCPLLPEIVPAREVANPGDLRVIQRVNGETLQDARTSDLIFDLATLVSYISAVMALDPGDVILTGTPPGVGYFRDPKIALKPGDIVEVEVEGVGTLSNPVAAAPESAT